MKISVLICTYNRGQLIHDTLKSIIEESSIKPDELIVVNGGGERDCAETIAYWKQRCEYLQEIKTVNINLANSRNIGLKACIGDLICLTDDDARVFPDWIEKMKQAHLQYPEAGAIGGEVVDAGGAGFLSLIADLTTFPRYEEVKEVRTLPGVNCSYKQAAVRSAGEQDITLFRGEDVDYNWRILKAGFKIFYVPEIKVYHVHRPSWKGLFKQHFMYGRAYYRVRKKWPEMYCVYPRQTKNVRDLLKWVYYFSAPLWNSWMKTKSVRNPLKRLGAIIVVMAININTIRGTLLQRKEDHRAGEFKVLANTAE